MEITIVIAIYSLACLAAALGFIHIRARRDAEDKATRFEAKRAAEREEDRDRSAMFAQLMTLAGMMADRMFSDRAAQAPAAQTIDEMLRDCTEPGGLLRPHEQRVVAERDDLLAKATRLAEFVDSSPVFTSLTGDEQHRLRRQFEAMNVYLGILNERIRGFIGAAKLAAD